MLNAGATTQLLPQPTQGLCSKSLSPSRIILLKSCPLLPISEGYLSSARIFLLERQFLGIILLGKIQFASLFFFEYKFPTFLKSKLACCQVFCHVASSLEAPGAARQAEVLRAPSGLVAQQGTWKPSVEAAFLGFPRLPALQELAMGSAKEAESRLLIKQIFPEKPSWIQLGN